MDDLKLELLKRGKHITHRKKADLVHRLRQYLLGDAVKQFQIKENGLLIDGFIRNNEKRLNLEIPVVIWSLFHAYSPYQSRDQLVHPTEPEKTLKWILR